MRLRLVLPRSRGRAGLGSLRRVAPLAAFALLAIFSLVGCGGSGASKTGSARQLPAPPAPRGPAFGLTEDNADLLWNPADPAPSGGAGFQAARERLTALHPRYVRLLVDWAALQPAANRGPSLQGSVDGCARSVGPCGAYAGLREELAAVASQQQAARARESGL